MSKHSEQSSYREKLIEHLFVGELLKLSWINGDCVLEVAKPEVDNSGYDIIAETNRIIRHIQLKASYIGSKTTRQKVHIQLSNKPSGCVVWIYFNKDTVELGPFYFFGGKPGEPLPDLLGTKVAKHTKGDQDGHKAERPNIRVLNKGMFTRIDSVNELYNVLFGHNA
jgi:hypothetical protein